MKIGSRLFIGFAIIILINVVAGAIIISNVGSIQHYYQNKKTMDTTINHLNACRLTESQFRSAYDTKLVVDFQFEYLNVSRDIAAMQDMGVTGGEGNLTAIQSSIHDYHNLVLNNIEYPNSIENLWRSEQDTILSPGGLTDNSNAIKGRVLQLASDNNHSWVGMQYLNDIQQGEKNFMSTHDRKYLDNIRKMENLTLNWADNDPELAQDMWRYDNNLEVLSSLYTRQADSNALIDMTVAALEQNVSAMDTGISTAFDDTLARTTLAVIALIALSLVLSILISLIVTRSISRPIASLSAVAQKIAGGDLRRSIDVKRNDEVGSLADSFRKMMSAIRSRMEFNDALVRNIVDAHMIFDDSGRIFYFNEPAIELTGYTISEAMSLRYQDLFKGLPVFINSSYGTSYDCILVKKDATEIRVECHMSTLKDGEGNRIGTMALIRVSHL